MSLPVTFCCQCIPHTFLYLFITELYSYSTPLCVLHVFWWLIRGISWYNVLFECVLMSNTLVKVLHAVTEENITARRSHCRYTGLVLCSLTWHGYKMNIRLVSPPVRKNACLMQSKNYRIMVVVSYCNSAKRVHVTACRVVVMYKTFAAETWGGG